MSKEIRGASDDQGGQPDREAKKAIGDLLNDISDGLELSKQLSLLASSHRKEHDHSPRIPFQDILQDCAHTIVAEVWRCRMEMEASGRVHFGSVVIEESADRDEPAPVSDLQWVDPMILPGSAQKPPAACFSDASPAVPAKRFDPAALGILRRLCNAILARPLPRGPGKAAARQRQGGA